ncbi:MAG: amidohydrolase family protein [Desulfobulbaceae bacterium]
MKAHILHRAPWIVPVSGPVLADGAVIVQAGRIVETGPGLDLLRKYPRAQIREHPGCALTPALVNAHIHLELSHLRIPELKQVVAGFTDWIATLLDLRTNGNVSEEEFAAAARTTLRRQNEQGVIALADIGNTDLGFRLAPEFPGTLLHFQEFLGRSAKTRRSVQEQMAKAGNDRLFTAHAPYSTHPELIRSLKERARRLQHPFPIHVAEPGSEAEMLSRGSGELYSFLDGRRVLEQPYQPPAGFDNPGSVRYLQGLGVLDYGTVCIHCVHVSEEEARILAAAGTRVCLCPGSNRYLRVGIAPVNMFLARGILPALGTDSAASNPELSLWREMRLLREDHPAIDPAQVFAMATLGGAMALGLAEQYGSLAPGRSGRMLAVPVKKDCENTAQLYDLLTRDNQHLQPTWVND